MILIVQSILSTNGIKNIYTLTSIFYSVICKMSIGFKHIFGGKNAISQKLL